MELETTDPTWRRGPAEGTEHIGVDGPVRRPGVPMEATPEAPADGAHWTEPERQPNREGHLARAGLDGPMPVVGSAQRPRGVSGSLRRAAYEIPEHFARHWGLLLLADRVDVVEDRLGEALSGPMEQIGFEPGARLARTNPLGLVAGAVVGAWLVKKLL